ncbi:gliding motility protein [Streptomyces sp. CWNU-52B]|uniref:gliding motility protein n=1 Tax=unclassified Streptomyces TaxID=2593676 RepID=UPI0039C0703D
MGVFARFIRKERPQPGGPGKAPTDEHTDSLKQTASAAEAEPETAEAAEAVEIPQQQSVDRAADNEVGENARK